MVTVETILISGGLITLGIGLGWVVYKMKFPTSTPVKQENAIDQLMTAKSEKGQSVVSGNSMRVSGKKGIFDK